MVNTFTKGNLRILNSLNLLFEVQETVKQEKIPESQIENFIKEFENKFLNQLKILCYKLFQNNKSKYLSMTQMIDKTISENAMLPSGDNLFKSVTNQALKRLEKNIVELKKIGGSSDPTPQRILHTNAEPRRVPSSKYERKKSPAVSTYSRNTISHKPLEKPVKTLNLKRQMNQSFHGGQIRKVSNTSDVLASKNQSFISHMPPVAVRSKSKDRIVTKGQVVSRKVSMGVDEYRMRGSNYSKVMHVSQQHQKESRRPKDSLGGMLRDSGYSRIRMSSSTGKAVKIVGNNSRSNAKPRKQHRVNTVGNVKEASPAQSIMTTHTVHTNQHNTVKIENFGAMRMHKTQSPSGNTRAPKASKSPDNVLQRAKMIKMVPSKENNYRSVPMVRKSKEWEMKDQQFVKKEMSNPFQPKQPLMIVRNQNQLEKPQKQTQNNLQVHNQGDQQGNNMNFNITGADNENPELRMVSVTDCDTPQRNSVTSVKGDFDTPRVDVRKYFQKIHYFPFSNYLIHFLRKV